MNSTDNYLLSFYLHLMNEHDYLSDTPAKRAHLLEIDDDVLNELLEEFLDFTKEKASSFTEKLFKENDVTEEDIEDEELYEEKQNELIGQSVKKALIYMLLNPTLNESTINIILCNPIEDIARDIKNRENYTLLIFKAYISFLVEYYFKRISDELISTLEKRYSWLSKIPTNRGFTTINEIARLQLRDLMESYMEDTEDPREFTEVIDDYLYHQEEPNAIKSYQIRLLLSDIYRYLKTHNIMLEIEDTANLATAPLLSWIETKLTNKDYTLPDDYDMRTQLYKQFYFISQSDFINRIQNDILEEQGLSYIIRPVNPLYFMD